MSAGINQSLLISYHMLPLSEGASLAKKRGRGKRPGVRRRKAPEETLA